MSSHSWDTRRKTEVQRIRGRKLQQMRDALFKRTWLEQLGKGIVAQGPLCVLCLDEPATIRDHVIALAEGGADDETNEQAIGERCHRQKTHAESQRGKNDYGERIVNTRDR